MDLIERGENAVLLAERIQLSRWTSAPEADGLVHIAILARQDTAPSTEVAQQQVDAGRAYVAELASDDGRLRALLERFGVTWEYVADDGTCPEAAGPLNPFVLGRGRHRVLLRIRRGRLDASSGGVVGTREERHNRRRLFEWPDPEKDGHVAIRRLESKYGGLADQPVTDWEPALR